MDEREKIDRVRNLIRDGGSIESVSSERFDDGGVLDVASGTVIFTRLNVGPTVKIKFNCGVEVVIHDVSESGVDELKEIIEAIYVAGE